MRVTSGRVIDGRIEVPGESFDEGAIVTILTTEAGETFALGPEDEAALLESMAQGDRGEVISAEDLLADLRRRK